MSLLSIEKLPPLFAKLKPVLKGQESRIVTLENAPSGGSYDLKNNPLDQLDIALYAF